MYRRTYEQILGYAIRRCSSPEDAADIVAETYVIAWQRIAGLPDGEAGKLWLYGVARRVLANHRRSERRRTGAGHWALDRAGRARVVRLEDPAPRGPRRSVKSAHAGKYLFSKTNSHNYLISRRR
ncbi:RNA polymerase sigma factor [Nonomuraea sp. NPDC050394]|uniref:RNA polymerase sigma factor n=1 Tax=Nonomuraea sp. NPDC050394 TaxID=3364363 RepID=UPI00378C6854